MFNNNYLEQITIPYWNIDDYFNKAKKIVIENFRNSYNELFKGYTAHWDCDIFFDELKGQRNRCTKSHYLTLGYKLCTNLNYEEEREITHSSEFGQGVFAIKSSLMNEFSNIISGVSINDPCNIFWVHLTKAKTREILLTPIGNRFSFDEYVLLHPDEIYNR